MIVDERMITYINSLDGGNGEFLDSLERQAMEDKVPIIRHEMQSFLRVFLALKKPKKISGSRDSSGIFRTSDGGIYR